MSHLIKYKQLFLFLLITIFGYTFIAYGSTRTEFLPVFLSFAILFFCYYKIVTQCTENLKFLIAATISTRLIFGWVLPNLSQDFYRFIWDGQLMAQGINPYLYLPKDLILHSNFQMQHAKELVLKMGDLSASHFSNYPPVNQFLFFLAGIFASKSIITSVIILRFIIVLADFGTMYFGQKLLLNLGLKPYRIFWYLLNPLVIIELSGNLHFEGVMLFFLVLSFYYFQKRKWQLSALLIGVSISIKLLPLMLLPLFYQKLGIKRSIVYYSIAIGTNLVLFLPFFSSDFIQNYTQTIGLYFTNFEFNASIYYLLREIGYYQTGYNMIHVIGKYTPIFIIVFIACISLFTKLKSEINIITAALLVMSVYFFMATTVHPWYIINLVLLSIFTNFKFAYYWSFLIILSYFTYSNIACKENMLLIFIEYSTVFFVFLYEIRKSYFLKK